MNEPLRIDVWSDIACPWCYLGKRRLEAALAQFARGSAGEVEVVYRSYQLAPDLPADFTGAHDAYLAAKLGWSAEQVEAANQRLRAVGAAHGVDYDFSTSLVANTGKAHELLHYAKAKGRQGALNDALFKAHFSDGVHIGRIADLADLAEQVGLDRAEALRVLETGEYAEAVAADKAQAAQYGIRGVPFFVLARKYGLSGAQEPETFLNALNQTARERAGL